MNFTCSGTVTYWRAAGEFRGGGNANSNAVLSIWRERSSEPEIYDRVDGIELGICGSVDRAPSVMGMNNVYECTLPESERMSVQPGDIVGIELSESTNARFRLYFDDNSGPTNYIFNGPSPWLQTVNLNANSGTEPAQPQISLTMLSSTSSNMGEGGQGSGQPNSSGGGGDNGRQTNGAAIGVVVGIIILLLILSVLALVCLGIKYKRSRESARGSFRERGIDMVAQNVHAVDVETKANLSYVPVFRQILTGDNIAYERNQAGNGGYLTIIAPTEDYAQVHGNIETQQNEEESHDVSYDYID